MIYQSAGQVKPLKEVAFVNEKEMQQFCEKNMHTLLGLDFVATEFKVAQFRFDSVAYSSVNSSFVIIEYKNTSNFSVIDQGYSYIATLLNHKADFVLKYNQVFHVSKGLTDFDWSQVRVVFIAPVYTVYQLNSINFNDLPMELWKINRYEQGIISFQQMKPTSTSASISGYVGPSGGKGGSGGASGGSTSEVVVYTEEEHLKNGSDVSRELYEEIKEYVMSLDSNLLIKPKKMSIGFLMDNQNWMDVKIQKNSILLWLNVRFGLIDDPRNMIKDVTNVGHHGVGDCQIKIDNRNHMGYIKDLIQAHYQMKCQD